MSKLQRLVLGHTADSWRAATRDVMGITPHHSGPAFGRRKYNRDRIGRFARKDFGGGGTGTRNVLGHRIERPSRPPSMNPGLRWGTPGVTPPEHIFTAAAEHRAAVRAGTDTSATTARLERLRDEGHITRQQLKDILAEAAHAARFDV